ERFPGSLDWFPILGHDRAQERISNLVNAGSQRPVPGVLPRQHEGPRLNGMLPAGGLEPDPGAAAIVDLSPMRRRALHEVDARLLEALPQAIEEPQPRDRRRYRRNFEDRVPDRLREGEKDIIGPC